MRSRTGLLRQLRESLVDEALRDGKPEEWAERYATEELHKWRHILRKRAALRAAVREC